MVGFYCSVMSRNFFDKTHNLSLIEILTKNKYFYKISPQKWPGRKTWFLLYIFIQAISTENDDSSAGDCTSMKADVTTSQLLSEIYESTEYKWIS